MVSVREEILASIGGNPAARWLRRHRLWVTVGLFLLSIPVWALGIGEDYPVVAYAVAALVGATAAGSVNDVRLRRRIDRSIVERGPDATRELVAEEPLGVALRILK